jgi:hypothetical protein
VCQFIKIAPKLALANFTVASATPRDGDDVDGTLGCGYAVKVNGLVTLTQYMVPSYITARESLLLQ